MVLEGSRKTPVFRSWSWNGDKQNPTGRAQAQAQLIAARDTCQNRADLFYICCRPFCHHVFHTTTVVASQQPTFPQVRTCRTSDSSPGRTPGTRPPPPHCSRRSRSPPTKKKGIASTSARYSRGEYGAGYSIAIRVIIRVKELGRGHRRCQELGIRMCHHQPWGRQDSLSQNNEQSTFNTALAYVPRLRSQKETTGVLAVSEFCSCGPFSVLVGCCLLPLFTLKNVPTMFRCVPRLNRVNRARAGGSPGGPHNLL